MHQGTTPSLPFITRLGLLLFAWTGTGPTDPNKHWLIQQRYSSIFTTIWVYNDTPIHCFKSFNALICIYLRPMEHANESSTVNYDSLHFRNSFINLLFDLWTLKRPNNDTFNTQTLLDLYATAKTSTIYLFHGFATTNSASSTQQW